MEVVKKVLRELFQIESIEEVSNRLIAPFGDFRIQVAIDLSSKTLLVTSTRPVSLNQKEGARKAQHTCLSFLPGVVIYDENCFKLVTSSLYLDGEQMEELLRAVLELHKARVREVYERFMDS
jgi:hypothetical protein